jgi:hypothetical protein
MKNEYIAGDLVKYLSQVVKIVEVYQDGTCYFGNETMCGQQDCKDAEPIPLTPEILEKNGWKRLYNDSSFWFNDNIGDSSEFEEFNGHFSPKIFKLPIIHYVHQLQHYFFGLGIKIEIKV